MGLSFSLGAATPDRTAATAVRTNTFLIRKYFVLFNRAGGRGPEELGLDIASHRNRGGPVNHTVNRFLNGLLRISRGSAARLREATCSERPLHSPRANEVPRSAGLTRCRSRNPRARNTRAKARTRAAARANVRAGGERPRRGPRKFPAARVRDQGCAQSQAPAHPV